MLKKRIYILIISITIFFFLFLISIVGNNQFTKINNDSTIYRLVAYENSVALYENEKILTIYDEIVLNSLPKYDQEIFKKGLLVSEIEKIDELLEDYE